MKRFAYPIIASLAAFGLAACSDDPSVDNHPKEQMTQSDDKQINTPDDKSKENAGNKSDGGKVQEDQSASDQMADLPFTKFELEVTYAPDLDYDFEYHEKSTHDGDYRAELVDELHNKRLKGAEALQAISTQMQTLELDANTSQEEAIQRTLDAFDLKDDYTNFELDYTLKDGTQKKFEDR